MPASNLTANWSSDVANETDRLFDEQVKTCSRCAEAKPVDDFHRNKNMRDGRSSACKACLRASVETGATMQFVCARCQSNCEKKNKGSQRYCDGCAAEIRRERDRARRPRTVLGFDAACERCEGTFARQHGKQVVCPACVKFVNAERGKRWAEANPDRNLARSRRYNDDNRDEVNRKSRERSKLPHVRLARRELDRAYRQKPNQRIDQRMKTAIAQSLKCGKQGRSWETLVGYSCDELYRHLEKQFSKGMSWKNMGDWHIDHIIPKSSFKYETDDSDEFRACWAITNLRPLWSLDNRQKYAKRTLLL